MNAPNVHVEGTEPQDSTLGHAAKVFEGLLFPPGEGQEPRQKTPDGDEGKTPTEPVVEQKTVESTPETGAQSAEPEPTPQPKAFKWKIGDEDVELTEDEARLGYLRQSDYTKKTQQAAEVRKTADQELASARVKRDEYLAGLEAAKQAMDALIPKEPDWAALRTQGVSAEEISAAVAQYQTFVRERDRISVEQKRVADEALVDAKKQLEARIADEEEKLFALLPEWRDPEKGKAENARLWAWLRKKGFSDDQIGSVVDHRLVVSLYNSMRYEEVQESTPAAKAKRPAIKTVAPGGPTPPKVPAGAKERAQETLARSGKVSDAAKLFEHVI